jgi:hypothetical protein
VSPHHIEKLEKEVAALTQRVAELEKLLKEKKQ